MTTDRPESANHYWYADDAGHQRGIDVLEAMRSYRAAESAMRRRSQASMGMGENDLIAMRYLLRATAEGKAVGPKELAQYLGITSASITVLLDRLEKNGHLTRQPSPFDRRALIIVPSTPSSELEAATLGDARPELLQIIEGLSEDDAETVVAFLTRMRDAVDQVDSHVFDRDERR